MKIQPCLMRHIPIRNTQYAILSAALFLSSCSVQKPANLVKQTDVERIIRTLSADDMQGRGIFTVGIDKAAGFIENEFREIGLQPLNGANSFRQEFSITRVKPLNLDVVINGQNVPEEFVMAVTDKTSLNWTEKTGVEVSNIKAGESFFDRYRAILSSNKVSLVLLDEAHADAFKRLREFNKRGRMEEELNQQAAAVFVVGSNEAETFSINFNNKIEKLPLFNVAAMLPGKSKEKELVVFSGHYDHIGIIDPVKGDSIANGADDDASGITAVISLAKHYKKLNNNERTLIFAAFTAEETGGYGSQHFSGQLNPDDVVAMFNIEMIGKGSKFGRNSAYITGYEKSDFGQILQRNLAGTEFRFYPDPYPTQNLFYRSDNATLAALGVPAHTISTVQIEDDKLYHTVNDEFETLDVNNIISTIKAIALSAKSIIAGTDTPKRIPKLEE